MPHITLIINFSSSLLIQYPLNAHLSVMLLRGYLNIGNFERELPLVTPAVV